MQPEDQRHHEGRQQDEAGPVGAPARRAAGWRGPSCRRRQSGDGDSMSSTLSQKIARQLVTWVSAPPSSGPMLKPSIRNPDQAPIAAARRSGAAPSSTAASVLGTANAAARPCNARPASNAVCVPAVRDDAGRDAEQRQAGHRRQPRAEPVRRLAAEHDERRGDDQVGIDRPLHAARAQGKLASACSAAPP